MLFFVLSSSVCSPREFDCQNYIQKIKTPSINREILGRINQLLVDPSAVSEIPDSFLGHIPHRVGRLCTSAQAGLMSCCVGEGGPVHDARGRAVTLTVAVDPIS
jgi:hypothetical protein